MRRFIAVPVVVAGLSLAVGCAMTTPKPGAQAAPAAAATGPSAAAGWRRLYEQPQAPFSWEPQEVVVLASGNLALSSGPVRDPAGRIVATFTSVWRQEAPGVWRVIFDRGNDVCDCARAGR